MSYQSPELAQVSIAVVQEREQKWRLMLGSWEHWITERLREVKFCCREGIPASARARAWQHLSGSQSMMESYPGKYQSYLSRPHDSYGARCIELDVPRQFPEHEMFQERGGPGQTSLQRVLLAYAQHNPEVVYVSAIGPVAAFLVMNMPEEEAFWTLACICDKYMPGYYSGGCEAVLIDGDILFGLLQRTLPTTYQLLQDYGIGPAHCMVVWFLCIFSHSLPVSTVLRVWDMFFCEGVNVLFRVALALFKLLQLDKCSSMTEAITKLTKIPSDLVDAELVVKESLHLPVTDDDIEEERLRVATGRKSQAK